MILITEPIPIYEPILILKLIAIPQSSIPIKEPILILESKTIPESELDLELIPNKELESDRSYSELSPQVHRVLLES